MSAHDDLLTIAGMIGEPEEDWLINSANGGANTSDQDGLVWAAVRRLSPSLVDMYTNAIQSIGASKTYDVAADPAYLEAHPGMEVKTEAQLRDRTGAFFTDLKTNAKNLGTNALKGLEGMLPFDVKYLLWGGVVVAVLVVGGTVLPLFRRRA